jgi:hypothetical protein
MPTNTRTPLTIWHEKKDENIWLNDLNDDKITG